MGGNYQGQFGDGLVKVVNFGKHPILEGVGEITSDKLYKAGPLAKAAMVLQQGDIGTDKHAVSWINNCRVCALFTLRWACPRILKTKTLDACLPTPFFGQLTGNLLQKIEVFLSQRFHLKLSGNPVADRYNFFREAFVISVNNCALCELCVSC